MSVFSMAGSNPALPTYPLQRSVRLRSSATAYFNRTPATAGNRKTWTWSAWVKRGTLGVSQYLFAAGTGGTDVTQNGLNFQADDTLRWTALGTIYRVTTQVFRDPSAWYHIVLQFDTTQATANDRIRLYVNGTQITAFSTLNNPTQNLDYAVNQAAVHEIGRWTGASNPFDGYLTEVNFIDGQALTPSSFGAYNSYGVWSPAKYTGTYGTNGFYLNFQDNSALTTTANIGIGKDSSGNGNYWTSNNISITAGVTYDSMLDVPTLTSATNSNYAVLNPLANAAVPTLTNGNLFLTTPTTQTGNAFSTMGVSSGNYYFEVTVGSVTGGLAIGVSDSTSITTFIGNTATSWSYYSTGQKYNNGTATAYGSSYTTNDVISVILNMDTGTLTFQKNSISQGQAFSGLTGTLFFAIGDGSSSLSCSAYVNFGQQPFVYPPGAAYKTLNTYNLPDSIVPVGAQYMAATTYTGNGSTQAITNTVNGFSMQPDMVWIKARSVAYNNYLEDSVRGVGKDLSSNLTDAEATYNLLTAFNSNGFTAFTNGTYLASNQNGTTYVAWQWRASNASAVTNTSGSITSQVSANQTAGFSVVTYTGTGANATVGHGLGVAPKMFIIKSRSLAGENWWVWHTSLPTPTTSRILLNLTNAYDPGAASYWNSTLPSSTVLSIGTTSGNNGSGATYVAYCFAAVPGYSAFGSYTGNGSTDGPFVYTGFRPRYILFKATTTSVDATWVIKDTSRNPSNVASANLYANQANAEDTASTANVDILSNGFKLRGTYNGINGSGQTYIYAAFAENPFKNALAR